MKRVLSVLLAGLLIMLTLAFGGESIASAHPAAVTNRHRYHHHKRTFWQKHRDKLTVAGSSAAGTAVGAIAGGGKGAAIGAGAGAGAGALYTYKIRKRHRHPHRY